MADRLRLAIARDELTRAQADATRLRGVVLRWAAFSTHLFEGGGTLIADLQREAGIPVEHAGPEPCVYCWGETAEGLCAEAWKILGYTPSDADDTVPAEILTQTRAALADAAPDTLLVAVRELVRVVDATLHDSEDHPAPSSREVDKALATVVALVGRETR